VLAYSLSAAAAAAATRHWWLLGWLIISQSLAGSRLQLDADGCSYTASMAGSTMRAAWNICSVVECVRCWCFVFQLCFAGSCGAGMFGTFVAEQLASLQLVKQRQGCSVAAGRCSRVPLSRGPLPSVACTAPLVLSKWHCAAL
jgi:hypothetical protein